MRARSHPAPRRLGVNEQAPGGWEAARQIAGCLTALAHNKHKTRAVTLKVVNYGIAESKSKHTMNKTDLEQPSIQERLLEPL